MRGWVNRSLKRFDLLFGSDVQENLSDARAVVGQHALELVDLAISPPPLRFRGEPFDALHQHAAVPGSVENDDLPMVRKHSPEALKVLLLLLAWRRRGDGMHLEASRIERPAKPPHDAAFSRRVPAFENDNGVLLRAKIRLLNGLQRRLKLLQPNLIIRVGDVWEIGDRRERRALRNKKFLAVLAVCHPTRKVLFHRMQTGL